MTIMVQPVHFQAPLAVDTYVDDVTDTAVLHALHQHQHPHQHQQHPSGSLPQTVAEQTSDCRSSLKTGSGPRKQRRKVSFCDKGHTCQHFDMYDEEWHPEIWFAHEDYDDMKAGFEFTIFMMDAGCPEKVEDNDSSTTRGLEKRTEDGQWRRYQRKRDYYNGVLDEQERQWDEDQDDHDKIGAIATACTRDSALEAYDVGVLDEITVYGHSLRNSTRKRQSQLADAITSSLLVGGVTEDSSDAMTAATSSESSSSCSEE